MSDSKKLALIANLIVSLDVGVDGLQMLINKVKRPDKIYEKQKWMNPKHSKKMSSIEDFVTVLPTSAES